MSRHHPLAFMVPDKSVFIFVENPLYRTILGGLLLKLSLVSFVVVAVIVLKFAAISIDLFEFILKFVEFLG